MAIHYNFCTSHDVHTFLVFCAVSTSFTRRVFCAIIQTHLTLRCQKGYFQFSLTNTTNF
uniref:Uncharacterized protein n=1 Tax=Anguilla anguilla TaxID=7936 RepID=A0A0E9WWD1_ANGAN